MSIDEGTCLSCPPPPILISLLVLFSCSCRPAALYVLKRHFPVLRASVWALSCSLLF